MNDSKVSSSEAGRLEEFAKSIVEKLGLRGGQLVLFNIGKMTHPAENNPVLLREYSEHCGKEVALSRAIPSYMAWLADQHYLLTSAESMTMSVPRALPEFREEDSDDEDQEATEGTEDTEEEL